MVRFKAPLEGTVTVHDLLRGKVSFDVRELDDIILQRSDGTPTYNFVVVVDDADMGITHVIRGDDHLSNTPKQALLYQALGYPLPEFAHISMILGADKTRLSKRHGATSTLAYRDMGYLPDALINYLVRLGWSLGDQEIFRREEMIRNFSINSVTLSAAVFNPEKLIWINEQYIQTTPPIELAKHLAPILVKEGILPENHGLSADEIAKPIPLLNQRAKTLVEMAGKARFYFKKEVEFDEAARKKFLNHESQPLLTQLAAQIETLDELTSENLETSFKEIVEAAGVKLGKLAQPVRVALTGKTESPGIYDTILLLGKETTLARLNQAAVGINSSE